MVKIKETSFLLNKCLVSIGQHCNLEFVKEVKILKCIDARRVNPYSPDVVLVFSLQMKLISKSTYALQKIAKYLPNDD